MKALKASVICAVVLAAWLFIVAQIFIAAATRHP